MTIDEALEKLSDYAYRGVGTLDQNFKDSIKLAIEALKYIKRGRDPHGVPPYEPLPGETK